MDESASALSHKISRVQIHLSQQMCSWYGTLCHSLVPRRGPKALDPVVAYTQADYKVPRRGHKAFGPVVYPMTILLLKGQ